MHPLHGGAQAPILTARLRFRLKVEGALCPLTGVPVQELRDLGEHVQTFAVLPASAEQTAKQPNLLGYVGLGTREGVEFLRTVGTRWPVLQPGFQAWVEKNWPRAGQPPVLRFGSAWLAQQKQENEAAPALFGAPSTPPPKGRVEAALAAGGRVSLWLPGVSATGAFAFGANPPEAEHPTDGSPPPDIFGAGTLEYGEAFDSVSEERVARSRKPHRNKR